MIEEPAALKSLSATNVARRAQSRPRQCCYSTARETHPAHPSNQTGANIESSGGATEKTSYTGYSLGLGYKQIIQGGLYGFGEVNYAAFSSKGDGNGLSGTNQPTATNILVGLGYKF